MKPCIACEELAVDPEEPPRYDVLSPEFDVTCQMSDFGPYCAACWPSTVTGAPEPEPDPDPEPELEPEPSPDPEPDPGEAPAE